MKASAAVSVLSLLAIFGASGASGSGMEGAGPQCAFSYNHDGKRYLWDLGPLYTEDDLVYMDQANHTFNFKVCGLANAGCFPSWKNYANYGVAILSWGYKITGRTCYDKYGHDHPCTSPCEVLGNFNTSDSAPHWEPIIERGEILGARHLYVSVKDGQDDPNWCDIDPKTGEQYRRQIVYHITCDKDVSGLKVVNVTQSPNNDCFYTLFMRSEYGCPTLMPSPLGSDAFETQDQPSTGRDGNNRPFRGLATRMDELD